MERKKIEKKKKNKIKGSNRGRGRRRLQGYTRPEEGPDAGPPNIPTVSARGKAARERAAEVEIRGALGPG